MLQIPLCLEMCLGLYSAQTEAVLLDKGVFLENRGAVYYKLALIISYSTVLCGVNVNTELSFVRVCGVWVYSSPNFFFTFICKLTFLSL